MTISRHEVPEIDIWNVDALYPSLAEWKKEYVKIIGTKKPPIFRKLHTYKGSLTKTAARLKECLDLYFDTERKLRKLYTYAHLRHDEDIQNTQYKTSYHEITSLYHLFAQENCWLEAELLAQPKKKLEAYLKNPQLQKYHFYLEQLIRLQPHTLDQDQEKLMALAQQALETPRNTFSAINDADFRFGEVMDSQGKSISITHASYALCLRSHDRLLRERSFQCVMNKYKEYENTLTELLRGQVEKHAFEQKARKYNSCLEASLFPKHVDTKVYRSLIATVRENISVLHSYMKLRKKIMKLDELHLYDIYVPMIESVDAHYTFDEAVELVLKSVQPLGEEYVHTLSEGLKNNRWVDRFENKNKRSGAYSSGCYDSMPYILMNFKGILRDVFTLAHEAGHSMHSFYSRKHQPYHSSDYTIFVAEVASTFNEELLMHEMLQQTSDKKVKAYLLNEKLEDIRATFFRQTMFAEFELFIHESQEARIPLTPQLLKDKYLELNHFYFGKDVVIDPEIAVEWARIPHFYYNFYVYQYATGISAATALHEKVLHGGKKEKEAYLAFLSSGSSDYPLKLLKKAGVDMTKKEPVVEMINHFSSLTKQLSKLI